MPGGVAGDPRDYLGPYADSRLFGDDRFVMIVGDDAALPMSRDADPRCPEATLRQ